MRFFTILVIVLGFANPCFSVTNDEIASHAEAHVGLYGDQCKIFIQTVLNEVGIFLGSGYRDCYSPGEREIAEQTAARGDVIQISNDSNPNDTGHVHSAFILDNLGNGAFRTVHSNWHYDEMVTIETWNPTRWAKYGSGENIIFPNYSAHFYRFGKITSTTVFDFKNNSPQGWTYGFDTFDPQMSPAYSDVWMVKAHGYNPGVVSPEFGTDISTQQFKTLEFRALTNCDFVSGNGYVYLMDGNGNWNYEVPFGRVACDGRFADYSANIGQFSLNHLKQLSIELTERADNDLWLFDHVRLLSHNRAWDFAGNLLGFWAKQDMHFLDYFPADKEWARFKATGKQPQLVSPNFIKLPAEYNYLEVRYSVSNGGTPNEAIARAYFDQGEGFSSNSCCWSQAIIKRNSDAQTVRFEVPAGLRGSVIGFMLDFFDNSDYQNYVIAVNDIKFSMSSGGASMVDPPEDTGGDDSGQDNSSSTNPGIVIAPSGNGFFGYDPSPCDAVNLSTLVLYPPEILTCLNQNDIVTLAWGLGKNTRRDLEFLIYWSLDDYQQPIANVKGTRLYFVSDRIPPGERVCFKIKTALCKGRAGFSDEVCVDSVFVNPNNVLWVVKDSFGASHKQILPKLKVIKNRVYFSVVELSSDGLIFNVYDAQTGARIND